MDVLTLSGMDEFDGFLTKQDLAVLELCEYLYDNGGRTQPSDLRDYWPPESDLAAIVRAADERALVTTYRQNMRLADTFPPPMLNSYGVRHVEDVREARSNSMVRARGCRNAMVRFVYGRGELVSPLDMLIEDAPVYFFGEVFTEGEINSASKYLRDVEILEGIGSHQVGGGLVRASLTARGIQCAEDFDCDVRTFLNRHDAGTSIVYSQQFNAPVTGQVAQGQNVHQEQTQGLAEETVSRIFEAMLQAVQDVPDADDRIDLGEAIASLREAATAESPDLAEVERRAGFVQRQARRVGAVAVTTATTLGTTELLQLLGGTIS